MNLEEQKNIYLNSGVRMNPELENQIKSNSLDLAKNPAFPKTDASGNQINFLELIAYKRFNDVVSLVKRYNPQINPASIGEVSSVLMGAVRTITNAEQPHLPKLEKLAVDVVVNEMEIPDGAFLYDAKIVPVGSISGEGFILEGKEQNQQEVQSQFGEQAEVENMTASELFEMEKHKRRFINMLIQGASKKGHYMFQLVAGELNEINPQMTNEYGKMMSANDIIYWLFPDETIKQMASQPSNMAGKEEIEDETDPPTLKVRGINFPVVVHELVKAIMEVFGTQGLPDDPKSSQMIIDSVDSLENETMDLRVGVPVWELFSSSYPAMVFEEGNRHIQHYLFARFCALEINEFFRVARLILSQSQEGSKYMERMANEIVKDLQNQDYNTQFGDDTGYSLDDILGYANGGSVDNEIEIVVVAKELEKDGGNLLKFRYLSSFDNEKDAIKYVKEMWIDEYDNSDLHIVEVLTADDYKQKYMQNKYDNGGFAYVDLFEDYENIPQKVQVILDKYAQKFGDDLGEMDYSDMAEMHKEIQGVGYTFESYLDNVPYGLRPIGVNLNELQGYEDEEDDKMENGGFAYVDLFEDYENIPANVQAILNDYELEESDYNTLNDLQNELAEVGYTFEFGLDAEPFALRPIGVEVNELQGYEDYEKGNFKSGGEANFDIFDYDKKMALINLGEIYEYAIKIDKMIDEDTDLEEWVKMKLSRIEQSIADVKHSLEGWEKYKNGGEIPKKQLLHIAKYSKDLIEMIQGGSRLMSWQEDKLAISSQSIDDIYHHLDYKMGNRAEDFDIENEEGILYRRGGMTKNQLISEIKKEMLDYGFDLTDKQISDYIQIKNLQMFETNEREEYLDFIAKNITGMSFPSYGDTTSYKQNFYQKLRENAKNKGYNFSGEDEYAGGGKTTQKYVVIGNVYDGGEVWKETFDNLDEAVDLAREIENGWTDDGTYYLITIYNEKGKKVAEISTDKYFHRLTDNKLFKKFDFDVDTKKERQAENEKLKGYKFKLEVRIASYPDNLTIFEKTFDSIFDVMDKMNKYYEEDYYALINGERLDYWQDKMYEIDELRNYIKGKYGWSFIKEGNLWIAQHYGENYIVRIVNGKLESNDSAVTKGALKQIAELEAQKKYSEKPKHNKSLSDMKKIWDGLSDNYKERENIVFLIGYSGGQLREVVPYKFNDFNKSFQIRIMNAYFGQTEEQKQKIINKQRKEHEELVKNYPKLRNLYRKKFVDGGDVEGWMQSALYQLQAEEDNDNLQISFVKNNEFTCQDDDANEYRVFKNEDVAEEMAVEEVREDIEYQPEMFNRDFLMDFVDVDDFLVLDIENANYDYVKEIEDESDDKYANRLIAQLVDNGLISENEALTTDPTELSDDYSQDYINLLTSEQIGDDNGIEYFIDNFGEDEFFKIVIDNNLIDFDNASKDAVNMDGIAHFLARYDGETIYLDNNVVAYRTN
jgi:hypothetical protein